MRESAFWQRIRRWNAAGLVAGKWQRVEVKLPEGFPDTIVRLQNGRRVLFVELKSVLRVEDLRTEVRAYQANWNHEWNEGGGEAYVWAWVGRWDRSAWFRDARSLRQGVFDECAPPVGLYQMGFAGA